MVVSRAIVLQIDLKDLADRPLQLTALSETGTVALFSNLKLIGEELWRCHDEGITVYDCQWNKIREIKHGVWARSVAALDTQTVVIATNRCLVISSTSGMNAKVRKTFFFLEKKMTNAKF